MNPDHLRYELHRVWVVESTLKKGERHVYKRRTFYVDEDSWQVVLVDQYDNRDQLWRVSEGHAMVYYDVPCVWTAAEAHIDLQAGRYLTGLFARHRTLSDGSEQNDRHLFFPADVFREFQRLVKKVFVDTPLAEYVTMLGDLHDE